MLDLHRQFEFAQQAKSRIRLWERDVVELVHFFSRDSNHRFRPKLLRIVSGKEYTTPDLCDRLEKEMETFSVFGAFKNYAL